MLRSKRDCMDNRTVEEVWPSDYFREKQKETLKVCLDALDAGYKNIVIDAPVGSGKSVLLTALSRYADSSFYTTPQKSLREQIQNDDLLEPFTENLKARRDYRCSITRENCKDCSIYNDEDESCAEHGCSYWKRKQSVMASDIAVITFSMLVVDGMIPEFSGETKISFGKRDVVCVDEAHGIVQQTADMHAGFDITPYGYPDGFISDVTNSVSWEANTYKDVSDELRVIHSKCNNYIRDVPPFEMTSMEKKMLRLKEKIERAKQDSENGYVWVVNVEGKNYRGRYEKVLELRPIYVGNFLNNFIWNRGKRRIISTATLPHRGNPNIWLKQVGLDPEKTKVISVGMTFPAKNRPVVLDDMVCSMSNGGDQKNWDSIMEKLNEIAKRYRGMKGICHTASYDRAERVEKSTTKEEHPHLYDNIFVHYGEKEAEDVIEEWQASNNDLLLTPSMMEGIDLKGDMGRYNILMKVPYPSKNSRIEYLLNETDYGWNSYFDRAAIRVAQAYGRTTRSAEDWSNFIILDKDYEKLKKKANLPQWLLQGEDYVEIGTRSIFDY